MLQELSIRNFALIDQIELIFPSGLILLTGETGAGKSIVIDALGLVLGARVSGSDLIRTGADRCTVEGVFDLAESPAHIREYLQKEGLVDDDNPNLLIVSREITRSSKNTCRINGRLMPVAALREATDGLIDIHGQHEHQTLLSSDRHLNLLDSWLGADALIQRADVERLYALANSIRRDLHDLQESAKERARNLDLYQFQKGEISSANLIAGEEEEMAAERIKLMNSEKLHALAEEAYSALTDIALDGLNSAVASSQRAAALDSDLDPALQLLNDALVAADESRSLLRYYRDAIEFNPERLEQIEERLNLIRTLKRKYGETVEEIISYNSGLVVKIDLLENSEERVADLTKRLVRAESELQTSAKRLSEIRRKESKKFGDHILSELRDLGMPQAQFEVAIEDQPVSSKGIDKVEFMISPNPGEPLKPLAKVASGGELSRIMLALKSVLSRAAYVPTLIFDEIDVGVGGRTAATIAEKLAALSQNAQVFCITHLPQIASQPAQAHYYIEKSVEQGRTSVQITPLDSNGRVEEIARMLGGSRVSQTVMQHAREMLAPSLTLT